MSEPQAIYFGCWATEGHFFCDPQGRSVRHADKVVPWGYGVESLPPKADTRQGKAALHHRDGWTALAAHDYTVDNRGGSKSVFCFPADLDLDEVLFSIGKFFPHIAARVGDFDVIEVTKPNTNEGERA